jgi:dihydroorotate dehydrogenase electron transfer subunit
MSVDIDAVVLSNDRLSEDYNVVKIAAPEISLNSKPGQFVMVKLGLTAEPLLRRPFSIFEILRNEEDHVIGFSLLNKRVGLVTNSLFTVKPGEHIQCLGPLGQPFSPVVNPKEAWMVAGGVGLAPFATLAQVARKQEVSTTLFYGGRTASDLYYIDMFERLGVRIVLATEDGSRGEKGFVTMPFSQALTSASPHASIMIYACGPTAMMHVVTGIAEAHNRTVEVSLEPTMGCGLGGCYSCVVPIWSNKKIGTSHFVRSCLEGPVFLGQQVDWTKLTH